MRHATIPRAIPISLATVRMVLGLCLVILDSGPALGAPFLDLLETHEAETRYLEALRLSPDGEYAYVTGGGGVSVFDRDVITGALDFITFEDTGGATKLAISPDGAHVYVSNKGDDTLGVFSRDPGTGLLTLFESHQDGVAGVSGLDGASGVEVSPDGKHVYVAGYDGNSVAVFARDAGTGALTFVEAKFNQQDGIGLSLTRAEALLLPSNGAYVYVGYDPGVAVFSRDAVTGMLTFIQGIRAGKYVSSLRTHLAFGPGEEFLYYATSWLDDPLFMFDRDVTTGLLVNAPSQRLLRNVPCVYTIAGDPLGNYVYLQTCGEVAKYSPDALTGALTLVESVDVGTSFPFSERGVRDLVVDPSGAHLYVVVDDRIVHVADVGGSIAEAEMSRAGSSGEGLWGATDVVVSPDGAYVYVASAKDDSIVVFARAPDGTLTLVTVMKDDVGGIDGLADVSSLAISPDGAHLYAGSVPEGIAVFERDAGTGLLTEVEVVPAQVNKNGFVFSPDGAHLYTNAEIFSRNMVTGALTFVAPHSFGDRPPTFSPDGLYAYYGSLVGYARDPASGLLTPIDVDGPGNFPDGATIGGRDVVSADGRYFYQIGLGLVSTFLRDPASGVLTFRHRWEGVVDLGSSFNSEYAVRTTVNEGTIFVAHPTDYQNDVVVLGFNARKGTFAVVAAEGDLPPVANVGLRPAMAVSPDGTSLYLAGSNTLAVYAATPCTPAVTKVRVILKGVDPDPDPNNDALVFKGTILLHPGPFAALDFTSTGARVLVERADGSTAADVAIPAGAFAGTGTRGWVLNAAGSAWKYTDKTGTPLNGIKKISVKDVDGKLPGHVVVKVVSRPAGSYPVTLLDLPLAVTFEFGSSAECTTTGLADADASCIAVPGSIRCKSP